MASAPQRQSENLEDRRVCAECIAEPFLRAEIQRTGADAECHYCNTGGKTWALSELANRVEVAFDQHYDRTADQPDGFESAMMSDRESTYEWERKGEQTVFAIMNAIQSDEASAEDLQEILDDRHFDFDAATMGDESEFAKDAHYVEKCPDDAEFQIEWNLFEHDLKTAARFFSGTALATLHRVFERLDEHRTDAGIPVVVVAGPGAQISSFFRARVFQSDDQLEAAVTRPDLEVGPPPAKHAVAGRMNAPAISVFYGALDIDTALSEVRPPVGSDVVTARFELLRSVRLLDVDALQEVFVAGSIFDPGYLGKLQHAKFLSSLSARMSRVVLPLDEREGYLVTQVIADYLANVVKLDGILYRSVQVNQPAANVVLFHPAAGIEPIAPPDTDFSAALYLNGEDGPEPMFTVWEEVPAETAPKAAGSPLDFLSTPQSADYLTKARSATLKVVPDSVVVHNVTRATYATVEQPVTRVRRSKTARPTKPVF